ncbi:rhomboid family intramembrane serine protease [Aridibaculum aurantiacum]|uniref:rhomboid family intramembrane serine protease n=1 Tax=Aridibaculum aurantiacum TaxID=2810307 RepID=UPI001A95FA07|nr:rhomboid family intramembrane serine protease [Aridibaculum aurantiacum]
MSVLEQDSRRKTLLGEDGNALTMLLIFNAIIFVAVGFVKVLYLLNDRAEADFLKEIVSWIAVPAAADVFASRPWTLISYMFSHVSLWHFISNMLWLWGFGFILNDLAGSKKVVPLFLYGGLVGSVVFILTINLIPALRESVQVKSTLLGAGPALMAIAIGTTTFSPRYKIFPMINGGIPLWIFTAIFVAIHLATIGAGIGAAAAYVAAGAMGFVFVQQLKQGNDWGQWMSDFVNWLNDLFNPEKKHSPKTMKHQLFYKADQKPFERTPHITQQRVDELLDKIHQKGYFSLTDEEKDFLKKAAKEEL